MKILHIVGQLEYGGVSSWLKNLISPTEPPFTILANYRGGKGVLAAEFEAAGHTVLHLPLKLNLPGYVSALRKILRQGQFQGVHEHRSFLGGASLLAARLENLPVRILFHHTCNDDRSSGMLRWGYEKLLRYLALQNATGIWACSNAAMRALYGEGWQADSRKRVIRSAVNPPRPAAGAREAIRTRLGIPDNAVVVGFAGRITQPKNPFGALESFRLFQQKAGREVHFIVCGNGPLQEAMKQRADGIANVHFEGFVPNVADYFQAFDLLLQPSYFEGLPLVTLEAQHSGLRVAGSNAPAMLEALPEEAWRYCAAPDNAAAHAEHLQQLAETVGERPVPAGFLKQFDAAVFRQTVLSGYQNLNNY